MYVYIQPNLCFNMQRYQHIINLQVDNKLHVIIRTCILRRYMDEILQIRCKTMPNQTINQPINQYCMLTFLHETLMKNYVSKIAFF